MKLSPAGINTTVGPIGEVPETPPGWRPCPPPSSPQGAVRAGQQVVEDIEGGLVGGAPSHAQLLQQQCLAEVGQLGTVPKCPTLTETSLPIPASSSLPAQGPHRIVRVSLPLQGTM